MTQFQTTAAYVSGGICGSIWWPVGQCCGKTIQKDLRGHPWAIMNDGGSFFDALDRLLMEEGGDFSGPRFTADTVIRIERRKHEAPGKYTMHVKEIEVARLCSDLVDADHYTSDFFGEEE